ncbi:MAG TPA: branched-chain amino acid ABC transporter permease [Atribacterota bacterium]|nr:branched-chain amino acid ABC transporter permease [Atribacterota bacterium]
MFLYLLQQLVNAISYGSILGLLAVGYTMIYGILGLINFAHGEIFMIGAFTCYLYVKFLKIPWFIAALLAITTSVIAGLLLEKIAYRPSIKKGSSVLTIFIISFAASMFLRYLFMLFFTDERKAFPIPAFFEKMYFVNGVVIGLRDIIIFTTTIIIMIAISYFVKYSKLGIAMRAVSYDSKTANYMGINSTLIIKTAFVLGSVLAGISGIEYGLSFGIVNPSMGFNPGLTGFIAAVLGGIGNVPGAMVAGFIVGIGEVLFVAMLPSLYSPLRPLFVWILLFFILFLKPTGLFRPNVKFEGGWEE